MGNRKAHLINAINNLLNSKELSEAQRKKLAEFDRFNELEAQCRLSTRRGYLQTLNKFGVWVQKPFEKVIREEMQTFIAEMKRRHSDGMIQLMQTHLKRFYRWVEWKRVNNGKPVEEKLELREVRAPYCVRWMKASFKPTDTSFKDLPTEEEVLRMAESVNTQRDRAMLLTLWETGCSPIELLNLRIKDIVFNQYGGIVVFPRYTNAKTKETNELKTDFRYRKVPIATVVPDLQLWISMHPRKHDLNSSLWWSQKGGNLGYPQFASIFHSAKRRAGITKRLTPYSFRHARLSQVAGVLASHELKRFAGHSRSSVVTARYLHEDEKAIEQKIFKERGVEVKETAKDVSPLTVKVCPRCKHKNSPTYRFCAMCSIPLDLKTTLEVQEHADALHNGSMRKVMRIHHLDGRAEDHEYGFDLHVTNEVAEILYPLLEWMHTHPERFEELQKQMWVNVAAEVMANAHKANP